MSKENTIIQSKKSIREKEKIKARFEKELQKTNFNDLNFIPEIDQILVPTLNRDYGFDDNLAIQHDYYAMKDNDINMGLLLKRKEYSTKTFEYSKKFERKFNKNIRHKSFFKVGSKIQIVNDNFDYDKHAEYYKLK
jgi:hypothetical protein